MYEARMIGVADGIKRITSPCLQNADSSIRCTPITAAARARL
jgi:hypothetical protein